MSVALAQHVTRYNIHVVQHLLGGVVLVVVVLEVGGGVLAGRVACHVVLCVSSSDMVMCVC